MAAGVGKTYRMLQEGQAEAEAGRDVVIGYLEPHERRRDHAPRRAGWSWCRAGGSPYRGDVARGDGPAGAPRPRAGAGLIDELAHTNPPASSTASATRTSRRARGRDRRLLDRQRPAPGVAQRPGRRADRGAGAGDDPRLGARRGRRGGADRPHPGGADRPPARGQGLPRRERSRPRSTTSSGSRTWPRCARSALRQVAEEVESKRLVVEASRSAPARSGSPPTAPKAVGERCWRWSGRSPAPSAWSAAPGARRSGSAPTSTCSGSSRRASRSRARRSVR